MAVEQSNMSREGLLLFCGSDRGRKGIMRENIFLCVTGSHKNIRTMNKSLETSRSNRIRGIPDLLQRPLQKVLMF